MLGLKAGLPTRTLYSYLVGLVVGLHPDTLGISVIPDPRPWEQGASEVVTEGM